MARSALRLFAAATRYARRDPSRVHDDRAMNIITKVKKLDLPLGQYVVIGSGIMAQRGLRAAKDVDIAVTPDLYATLRASSQWEEEERYGKIFLKKEAVEINPRLDWESYSTTAEAAIASATIIDGVPFMNLNELVKFKRGLGRAKDLADIVIIEAYLARQVCNP